MDLKKVHIRSFGCQMNKLDSKLVENSFLGSGFVLTDSPADANAVLINTCSVRDHAEQRVLSLIGHLKHLKKSRPDIVVAVFGCMAQRLKKDLFADGVVNIVCGPLQIPELVDMVKACLAGDKNQLAVSDDALRKPLSEKSEALDKFELAYDEPDSQYPSQAFVRVMRGCNNFCTYCIVPYVRGPEISRPPEQIVQQVKHLADKGIKQITLLGQTVNSYKYGNTSFADLLYKLSDVAGIEWLKFITCYPRNFDRNIFKAIADLPKVCGYLHMPAQSGSDRVLKAMNRHYTAGEYLDILADGRAIVPDLVIAGDFIVGFSGETDEDFQKTVNLVKKAKYKNCFIFKYSPRPGTKAVARLADDVPAEVKKQRNIELLAVQQSISEEFNCRYVGQTLRVLVEGVSKKSHLDSDNGDSCQPQLISRTAGDCIVVFDGAKELVGNFTEVEITRSSALTLFGRLKS